MEKTLISVIVPVYNGEKFIDRVMSSLINQCSDKIEIILVNDGSIDNSSKICHAYKDNYSNIKVVDKANGGLSTARNAGLKVAKGMYVTFIDVDDTLEYDFFEVVMNVINSYNPDCIDFGMKYISGNNEVIMTNNKLSKNTLLNRTIIENRILPPLLNLNNDKDSFVYPYVCNKVFKTSIINSYNILFDEERRTWEDRIFVCEYLKYANSYYSIDKCFYNYMDTPNSLSRKYDLSFFDIILKNFNFYYNEFSDLYDFNTSYVNDYWASAIENMIFRSLEEIENKETIENNIKKILSNRQVIEWYSKRSVRNDFDKRIIGKLLHNEADDVLIFYKRLHKKNKQKEIINSFIFKLKHALKRILNCFY